MSILKVRKASILPEILEPSTLYLINGDNNLLSLYLTDKDAIIYYKTYDRNDIYTIVNEIGVRHHLLVGDQLTGVPVLKMGNIGTYVRNISTSSSTNIVYLTDDGTINGIPLFLDLSECSIDISVIKDTTSNSVSPWIHLRTIDGFNKYLSLQVKRSNTGSILIGGNYSGNVNNTNPIEIRISVTGVLNGQINTNQTGDLLVDIVATHIDGQNGSFESGGDYVWNDLIFRYYTMLNSSVSSASYKQINGNFFGFIFNEKTLNQVWGEVHVTHDISLGTKIYPHIHWMPMTTSIGVVRWGIEFIIAKGHSQQSFDFANSQTIYLEHQITTNSQYLNIVTETDDANAILSSDIEPDSIIKLRVFRDAGHPNDTFPDPVHSWQSDLHYQIARLGTRHRSPDFFTP